MLGNVARVVYVVDGAAAALHRLSGMPSRPARRRWFQSWRVRPMRSYPWACRSAATAEESTPPDMATAMVLLDCIGFVFDDTGWTIVAEGGVALAPLAVS